VSDENTDFRKAFRFADALCVEAVTTIRNLISAPGSQPQDWETFRDAMTRSGKAIFGVGRASGSSRATGATKQAIECPLMEEFSLSTAKSLVISIEAGDHVGGSEIENIVKFFHNKEKIPQIYFGRRISSMSRHDEISISFIAIGLS
jgi:cell division protein FtsZ